MKIAVLTPSSAGHSYPMTTLARRIKNRGHDVVAIGTADLELFVRAAGLPFAVYCEEEFPAGIEREVFEELSRLNGREALEFTHRAIANLFRAAFDDLPRVLHETRADALALDGVMIELGLVPTHLGVPYVHVSNALHYDFSGWTPIFAFDWPHETTAEAIARNKEGVRAYLKLLESNKLIARAYAERVGLNFDSNNPLEGISIKVFH